MPDPVLGGLTAPLQVQVANLTTDVCWGAAFAAGDLVVNDAAQLKAKASH